MSQIENTNNQLERTNAALERTNAALERTNAALERTNAALERTNAALERTNANLERTNANLERTNANLEHDNATITRTNAALENTNNQLERTNAALESTNANLEHANATIMKTNATIMQKNASMAQTNDWLKQSNDALEQSYLSLVDVCGNLEQKYNKQKKSFEILQISNQQTLDELAKIRQERYMLEQNYQQLSDIETKYAKLKREHIVSLNHLEASLSYSEKLQKELQQADQQCDDCIINEQKIIRLQKKYDQLTCELSGASIDCFKRGIERDNAISNYNALIEKYNYIYDNLDSLRRKQYMPVIVFPSEIIDEVSDTVQHVNHTVAHNAIEINDQTTIDQCLMQILIKNKYLTEYDTVQHTIDRLKLIAHANEQKYIRARFQLVLVELVVAVNV